MSNQPPIEVPQGAIRLNTDSQRLEFFAQDRWYEFATDSPTLDGGSRGLFMGGSPNTAGRTISFITIPTQGNATDFGDMSFQAKYCSSCASRTRAVVAGGESPQGKRDEIEFVTISSTGDTTDFGNLLAARTYVSCAGNQTRGIIAG